MNVVEAIKKRRSIRKFQDREVPDEVLKTLLECACLAPSAGNRQPWVFIAVRSPDLKARLVDAAMGQVFLAQAPVVVVVCADPEKCAYRYEDRGRTLYAFQDTASAMTNMILAATSFGLGTCWVGAFKETDVRSALELPPNLRPVALLPIGYPNQERGPRNLEPFEQVVWYR